MYFAPKILPEFSTNHFALIKMQTDSPKWILRTSLKTSKTESDSSGLPFIAETLKCQKSWQSIFWNLLDTMSGWTIFFQFVGCTKNWAVTGIYSTMHCAQFLHPTKLQSKKGVHGIKNVSTLLISLDFYQRASHSSLLVGSIYAREDSWNQSKPSLHHKQSSAP